MIFCSIASAPQLPMALVLARSLKRHHPDSKFVLLMLERSIHPAAKYSHFVDEVMLPEDLQIKDWAVRLFSHRSLDATSALKAALLKKLLKDTSSGEIIVYVNPDLYAFGPFHELKAEATNAPILLVPHILEPSSELELDRELTILLDGAFSGGLLALTNCKEAHRFVSWWGGVANHYINDLTAGYFMDQKWLVYAPTFFETTILRHPGYLVGAWNLHERGRKIVKASNGFAVDAVAMRCFSFHNVGGILDDALRSFPPDKHEVLYEAIKLYQQELRWMDWTHLLQESWSYGSFADGTAILDSVRLKYRKNKSMRSRIPNPYSISSEEFQNKGGMK
jgi:hypothetical protein